MLGLELSDDALQALRRLKDAEPPVVFGALVARVGALRIDPGDPRLRTGAWRVSGDETIRVSLVRVPQAGEDWLLVWTVAGTDDDPVLAVIHVARNH